MPSGVRVVRASGIVTAMSRVFRCVRHQMNSSSLIAEDRIATPRMLSAAGTFSTILTKRFAFSLGKGRRRTALITLKTLAVAPIPSARVDTATTVNTGFLANVRNA